ncbi:MAG: hypothetical protein M3357_08300 [Actinomycetota bacterium]|nr:hypothetical protein [Actinomycetota bacterium]
MIADALSPTLVPLAVVAVLVTVCGAGLLYILGRGTGPGPADTAVAYEHAWDRLDFATLWNLSSEKLRDGRSRADFVAGKRAAYQRERELSRLVRSVRPEVVDVSGPLARVVTHLELADGQTVRDEMLLEKVGSAWRVTAYHLARPRKGET